MAYNKKFKPTNPVVDFKKNTKKRNVTLFWRTDDIELRSKFEEACKATNLKETDMLRQMISYSIDRMAT